jgi:DNA-binding response OmpR family regulator
MSRKVILVVQPNPDTLAGWLDVLQAAGYDAVGVSSFEEGRRFLAARSAHLLIADVRLGAFNGLQLAVRARFSRPEMAILITSQFRDRALEMEATRQGAAFLLTPVSATEFLAAVEKALARPQRRWRRRWIAGGLSATVAGAPARIVDISYGGLCFEVPAAERDKVASPAELEIPTAGVTVKVAPVWVSPSPARDSIYCGAALTPDSPTDVEAWQTIVDSVGEARR